MTDEFANWKQLADATDRKTVVMSESGQEIMDSDRFFGRPVIGKIVILPRRDAKEFKYDKPWACISITGLDEPWPEIDKENRVGLLQLDFDDIEFLKPDKKVIQPEQVNSIWNFVGEVWDEIDLLMIHCHAGISRSAAVAQAVSDTYQPSQARHFRDIFSPNKLVYKYLREKMDRWYA
jgi:predicted protein tyrosine phosphatase